MSQARGPDRGSATVLVLGICSVAFALVTTVAGLGSAVIARHRAESVADLAALAAADVLLGRSAGTPCDTARQVVSRTNHADHVSLLECRTHGRRAWVGVAAQPAGWVALLGVVATADASAGPAPTVSRS